MSTGGARTGYPQAPVAELERVFRRIGRERMAGLPLLNQALRVEALGFRRNECGWSGILITPWFMNLMLLPALGVPWPPLAVGKRRPVSLPAGTFEMQGGEEAELGPYLYCPMFSTMSAFADHEIAREIAREVMGHLFDAATAAEVAKMNPTGLAWTAPPGKRAGTVPRREFVGLPGRK